MRALSPRDARPARAPAPTPRRPSSAPPVRERPPATAMPASYRPSRPPASTERRQAREVSKQANANPFGGTGRMDHPFGADHASGMAAARSGAEGVFAGDPPAGSGSSR